MDNERFIGRPKISELIAILERMKEKYGDIPTAGAYDGNWEEKVEVLFFEGKLIIGAIS